MLFSILGRKIDFNMMQRIERFFALTLLIMGQRAFSQIAEGPVELIMKIAQNIHDSRITDSLTQKDANLAASESRFKDCRLHGLY